MSNIFKIEKYATLEELINVAKDNFIIYGDLEDGVNTFESYRILKGGFRCGISYYYTGLQPEVFISDNYNRIFIGFDKFILCIDLDKKELKNKIKMGSLFYEFINIGSSSLIVVICELELIVVDYNGNIKWSIDFKDIIEDFSIEKNGFINIKCSDEQEFKFNIQNGQCID